VKTYVCREVARIKRSSSASSLHSLLSLAPKPTTKQESMQLTLLFISAVAAASVNRLGARKEAESKSLSSAPSSSVDDKHNGGGICKTVSSALSATTDAVAATAYCSSYLLAPSAAVAVPSVVKPSVLATFTSSKLSSACSCLATTTSSASYSSTSTEDKKSVTSSDDHGIDPTTSTYVTVVGSMTLHMGWRVLTPV
jgi:hypothetical protein